VSGTTKITVAVAQATPVVLDRAATIAKACEIVAEAGRRGARVVAFPETWVPCYPLWCDAGTLGTWGSEPAKKAHARLVRESVVVPSRDTAAVALAARRANVAVVLGVNEREGDSLWNSLVFFREDGEIAGVHRKLVPTHGERLVWGRGDAAGLRPHDMGGARVGGLVCWEHWMPLARHVLHASGEQVHVAAWPHAREIHQIASRHYAFEGRAFVLVAASYVGKADLPADFELRSDFEGAPQVLLEGGSAIVAPDGSYVVTPVTGREELLTAEIDIGRVVEEKLTLDVAGHYARPDLFDVVVRRERPAPFRDG
jgi:predicted amidohydrolase